MENADPLKFPDGVPPLTRSGNDNEPLLRTGYRAELISKNVAALEATKKVDWITFRQMSKSLNGRTSGLLAILRRSSLKADVASTLHEMEQRNVTLEESIKRMRESSHGNWVDEPETFIAIGEMIVRDVESLRASKIEVRPEIVEEARRFRAFFREIV